MQTEFAEAALRYAKMGLAVIPLYPGQKNPIFKNWTEIGTADIPLVTRWWTQNPDANVGILTGQKSHCFVFDVDAKKGGVETYESILHKYGRFPDTWQDMTGGDGGGFHLYFRYPNFEVRNAAGIMQGIDIRGDGGQVVAPPSIHPDTGRRYEWDGAKELEHTPLAEAPLWLLELLQGKSEQKHSERFPLEVKIPHGVQHSTLVSLAGMMRRLGLDAAEIKPTLRAVNQGRCEQPGSTENIDKIADSMMKYRPSDHDLLSTANKLWRLAKRKEVEHQEEQDRKTVHTVDGLTVYRAPVAEQRCVVDQLLFHGLTLFAGRPKTGKSYLALQLALAVSHGEQFIKARSVLRPGRVLYAALEESQARTSSRMKKFRQTESILLQNISMIYKLLPMFGGGMDQLEEAIKQQLPNLVIIDTFLAFVGNSGAKKDVMRAEYAEMSALHSLAEKHDVAILLIHHLRKPTIGGKGLDAVAGSTGLTAAADVVWTMEREEPKICSLDIVGREAEEQTLALQFTDDGWELIGTGEQVKDRKDEKEIYELLKNEGALIPSKVASLLRMNANKVRSILYRMHQDGLLTRTSNSMFCLPQHGGREND